MEISVTFAGQKQKSIKLERFVGGLPKNMTAGLTKIGAYATAAVKAKLKPSNPLKLKKSPHKDLRSRTGMLRRSINYRIVNHGKGMIVGPNIVYARIHEFGGKAGRGRKVKIPKRAYFWPTIKGKWKELIKLFSDTIFKPIRR
ncbi:MAG: phage virion morphogenesis protein [Phycisphaerales bacterium]|jgi:phage gpG-like protein